MAFTKGPGGEIGGISCLSPDKLDIIFSDNLVNAKEIFLFKSLMQWRDDNIDVYPYASQVATRVAQHLDFSAMHASDIEEIVLPSGIVDSQSLLTGLMTVAKAAEKKGISLRSARRKAAKAAGTTNPHESLLPTAADPKGPNGRGNNRRFKKPIQAPQNDVGSMSSNETRDVPEQIKTKKTTTTKAIKSPKGGIKFRASKFFGSMRNLRSVKEQAAEGNMNDRDGDHLSDVSCSISEGPSNDVEDTRGKPTRHAVTSE